MKHPLPKQIFVAGTGTGVGKTVVSAILTEALQADYWKPIQSGGLDNSDSMLVRKLVTNPVSKIHPETYRFKTPASPHYASQQEGVTIKIAGWQPPVTENRLVIEGAGGLMVPLTRELLFADLILQWHIPAILVAKNYLGAINHTLLSADFLRGEGIPLMGIIFNGPNYLDNEEIITHFSRGKNFGAVEETTVVDTDFVKREAQKLKASLSNYYTW